MGRSLFVCPTASFSIFFLHKAFPIPVKFNRPFRLPPWINLKLQRPVFFSPLNTPLLVPLPSDRTIPSAGAEFVSPLRRRSVSCAAQALVPLLRQSKRHRPQPLRDHGLSSPRDNASSPSLLLVVFLFTFHSSEMDIPFFLVIERISLPPCLTYSNATY